MLSVEQGRWPVHALPPYNAPSSRDCLQCTSPLRPRLLDEKQGNYDALLKQRSGKVQPNNQQQRHHHYLHHPSSMNDNLFRRCISFLI